VQFGLSRHAEVRMKQRGLKKADAAFILEQGSHDGDSRYLSRADVEQITAHAKLLVTTANRLRGKSIICDGDLVITAFHDRKRLR